MWVDGVIYVAGGVSAWDIQAKEYNTCITPQAAHRNCRGAGHDTERAGIGLIGRRLSLRPQADLLPTSHTQSGLPFNGLHPCNPSNCIDYYSFTDPDGMEGWVGLVGWHLADTLPSKWSHVNHISGVDQGKSASQRLMS